MKTAGVEGVSGGEQGAGWGYRYVGVSGGGVGGVETAGVEGVGGGSKGRGGGTGK